jgi:hypothetical protein
MFYADGSELVAELILHEHACGPDCLCWEIRRVPAIEEALAKLGLPKLQTINEATADLVEKLDAQKLRTAAKTG